MSEKIQKLEQTVTFLKARAFDVQEQLGSTQAQLEAFGSALSKIAAAVGITGESAQLADIVAAVEALVPVQEQLDFVTE